MNIVRSTRHGALEGLDSLERPKVVHDNSQAAVSQKTGWGGLIDLQHCALMHCSYPVLNPSGFMLTERLMLVVATGFHGFSGESEAARPTVGTVSGAWGPSFQSLVAGFFHVDPDSHRVRIVRKSVRYVPDCMTKPCRFQADRAIDPRLAITSNGHIIVSHSVFINMTHNMAYQCLNVDTTARSVQQASCRDGSALPEPAGWNLLCSGGMPLELGGHRHEKNWAFFISDAPNITLGSSSTVTKARRDFFVYEFMPKFTVLHFDLQTDYCEMANVGTAPGMLDTREHVILNEFVANAIAFRLRSMIGHSGNDLFPKEWRTDLVHSHQEQLREWLGNRLSKEPLAKFKKMYHRAVSQQLAASDDCHSRSCTSRRFLAVVRGGTPGVAFDGNSTLFVAHATIKQQMLPRTAHAAQTAANRSSMCAQFGRWHKDDYGSRTVDHCDYLASYPSVYTMVFVVVDYVTRDTGKYHDAPTSAFGISHISPVFLPPNRYVDGSKIVFPAGLSRVGDGFHITYGENDRFANSFFVSESDVRKMLLEPKLEHTPSWISEPLHLEKKLAAINSRPSDPLPVIVLGHKQGTFWFLDIIKGSLGLNSSRFALCTAPRNNRLFPETARGGLWRFRSSDGFERHMSLWSRNRMPLQPCEHFLPAATSGRHSHTPRGRQPLMIAYDLWGRDLVSLVATCAPELARSLLSRPGMDKFDTPLLLRWQRARRVCSIGAEGQPFSVVRTIRDPRDTIVSGYHHHKSCPGEPWVTSMGNVAPDLGRRRVSLEQAGVRLADYGISAHNISYCDMLRRVPEDVGLALEIAVASTRWLAGLLTFIQVLRILPELEKWVHLVKYEELWLNLESKLHGVARDLFPWGGVSSKANEAQAEFEQQGVELTRTKWRLAFEANRWESSRGGFNESGETRALDARVDGVQMVLRNMRRGTPGQWKEVFSARHFQLFNATGLGELLRELAYET